MGNLVLFPGNDSACPYLIRLDFETAVFDVEHVRLLCEDSGQQTNNRPAQEPAVGSGVAPVEERVLLLGVTVNVAVDPDLSFLDFCQVGQHLLSVEDFRLDVLFRRNPLAV